MERKLMQLAILELIEGNIDRLGDGLTTEELQKLIGTSFRVLRVELDRLYQSGKIYRDNDGIWMLRKRGVA